MSCIQAGAMIELVPTKLGATKMGATKMGAAKLNDANEHRPLCL